MITHRASLLDRCTRLSSDGHVARMVSEHHTVRVVSKKIWQKPTLDQRSHLLKCHTFSHETLLLHLLLFLFLFPSSSASLSSFSSSSPLLFFFPSPLFQHLCSLCDVIVFSIGLVSLLSPLHHCPQPPPSPPHYHLNIIVLLFSSLSFWKRRKKRKRIREGRCEIPNHYLPPLPPSRNFFCIFVLSYYCFGIFCIPSSSTSSS